MIPGLARILDLVYAPRCSACDATGMRGLCTRCSQSLYPIDAACPRCAAPIEGPLSLLCRRCRRRPPPFVAAVAPFRYGGELARALRRLKYRRRPDLARDLAPLCSPALAVLAPLVDLCVPVPLHWRRRSARGYNQAVELLRFAARGLPLTLDPLSLRRTRATAPQSGLSARERRRNVASAFAVVERRRHRLAGRRVLLFDDVMTTGATMTACARALRHAGAASVLAFCVARAEP